jgi:hypothetical protein
VVNVEGLRLEVSLSKKLARPYLKEQAEWDGSHLQSHYVGGRARRIGILRLARQKYKTLSEN